MSHPYKNEYTVTAAWSDFVETLDLSEVWEIVLPSGDYRYSCLKGAEAPNPGYAPPQEILRPKLGDNAPGEHLHLLVKAICIGGQEAEVNVPDSGVNPFLNG